jgi:hypothetical protein
MNGESRPEAAHALSEIQSSNDASGAFTSSLLAPTPREPLEQVGPSPLSSETGRLYRGDDGSDGMRDETAARLAALGIDSPLHKSFACVLSGHEHQARVHFTNAGFWHYYCDGLGRGVGLADVRAFIAYGSDRHVSNLEAVRWRESLDFEAHLRWPVPLAVELPEPCPETARILAGMMRLFVGLRSESFPLAEPFPFASDFAQAYCGLSEDRVRAAKSWLTRAGVIYRTGTHGRSILWKLVAQDQFPSRARQGGAP